MKKFFLVAVLLVLVHASPAVAQPGPYLGAGFVYNFQLGSDIRYLAAGPGLDFTFGYNFGPLALEGNLMGSRHRDTDPEFGHADFSGFTLDLKVFLSPLDDPNQIYLLAGIGSYSIDEFDPTIGLDTELDGSGWDVGVGVEHFFNENVALNLGLIYRFIRYDQIDLDGTLFSLNPHQNGDVLTLKAGINFYW